MTDDETRETMSEVLGWHPVRCCASGISRVRRDRYYWLSVRLSSCPGFTVIVGEQYDLVLLSATKEPFSIWIPEGWCWPFGEQYEEAVLPTFTRAIPRTKPPPSPAGISQCDSDTLDRWWSDALRFPPYTYQDEFCLLRTKTGERRVAGAGEREILMGYPEAYTKGLHAKKKGAMSERRLDDLRCQAIGNTFHAGVIACLVRQGLRAVTECESITPEEIQQAFYAVARESQEVQQNEAVDSAGIQERVVDLGSEQKDLLSGYAEDEGAWIDQCEHRAELEETVFECVVAPDAGDEAIGHELFVRSELGDCIASRSRAAECCLCGGLFTARGISWERREAGLGSAI